MRRIDAAYGSSATTTQHLLYRTESSQLTIKCDGNEKHRKSGIVRHSTPTLESRSAWAHVQLLANTRNHTIAITHLAGSLIERDDILIAQICSIYVFTINAIQLP